MSETVVEVPKQVTEYTKVVLTDGREISFPGKRKVQKDTLIDESKIVANEDGSVTFFPGAVSNRFDFLHGGTLTLPVPLNLLARFAGHGGEQKYGDEYATTADKPLTSEDMQVAVEDLYAEIIKGSWGKGRAAGGGGVSGAGVVIQALVEATGKDVATIKAYLQKKIDTTEGLTRKALYDSFRVAGTKTGIIIARLEAAKVAKGAKVDADAELDSIGA